MKQFLYIFIFILILGCGSKRPIVNTVNTFDSTYVEKFVKIRDTIVKIPSSKVGVVADAKDLNEEPIKRSNGNSTVELYKKNDSIFANASCDSLELQLKLKDSLISTYRLRETDTTITLPPVEIKYIPWLIKILAWIGGLSLLYFGFRLFRFIQSFYNPISFLK